MNNEGEEKEPQGTEIKKGKSRRKFLKRFLKLSLFFSATSVCLMAIYVSFLLRPKIPPLEKDEWWGPYPINMKTDDSVRPFKIEFSDVMINDLRERLLHRRPFTPPLENAGFTYGFNSKFLNQVLDYWHNSYNFKEREQYLNMYEHFKTNIQGLDIHFLHVVPKDEIDGYDVVPLLMLHGWPGSVVEFYDVIPKLTTPRPDRKFVFEIIAPSLPGYGFSQAAVRKGLGPAQVAVIMNNLMRRLGHEKYYIQGGGLGHTVGAIMATLYQDRVLGYHTNFPVLNHHPAPSILTMLCSMLPRMIVGDQCESRGIYGFMFSIKRVNDDTGFIQVPLPKPDTVGIGLTDSPAGLAAYILEKFSTWTNSDNKRAADGNLLDKFLLTQLLDNIMIYWTSNSITTSMRIFTETFSNDLVKKFDLVRTKVPTCGIKFKYELTHQPDFVLRIKYKNYLHSTIVEDGGHFAAMEKPDILADDIFLAVSKFRDYHNEKGGKTPTLTNEETPTTVYDFTVRNIYGRDVKLEKYRGKVLIIVNVASECGLTDINYKQLNELHEKYYDKDLRILAFPCNQFGGQEPGNSKQILNFAQEKQIKFDMFDKIEVNGPQAHPLWKFLKQSQSGTFGDFIKWNFSKFIIDKNGVPVERLAPNVTPLELEPYLAKYW